MYVASTMTVRAAYAQAHAPDLEILHTFPAQDVSPRRPISLIQASDGALYGTTSEGGVNGCGALFRLTADDQLSVIYSFEYRNGIGCGRPQLAFERNQVLYGTQAADVFQVTTDGQIRFTRIVFGGPSLTLSNLTPGLDAAF